MWLTSYLVPLTSIEFTICLISDNSSGLRWIFPKFSSNYLIFFVPGIATILSPYKNYKLLFVEKLNSLFVRNIYTNFLMILYFTWAITQAKQSWPEVTPFLFANSLILCTSFKFRNFHLENVEQKIIDRFISSLKQKKKVMNKNSQI